MDAGLKAVAVVLLGASLCGCASIGYYASLARGQMDLMSRREPIGRIVEDPARDAELRRRLALVLDARRYAVDVLGLPDNGSYTLYADLERPYVVWNVFATPEFSLEPIESCFPLTGCVAYRGHYRKERAQAQAEAFKRQGYDVEIGGVPAYSTLGWFDDPVLNTMMHWSDAVLVGTIFHELGHQQLYVKHDTLFNESYSSFIEQEGARSYFAGDAVEPAGTDKDRRREAQFVALVVAARKELEGVYASPLSPEAMRARKAETFARLKRSYAQLRDAEWAGEGTYDRWFARDLNNASLLPVGLYDEWVPAFRVLFEQSGRDWKRFHAACKDLAQLGAADRKARLAELLAASPLIPAPDEAGGGSS